MFLIICAAGFIGAVIATALIFLFHLKGKPIILPYILFFVCILAFGAGAFLFLQQDVQKPVIPYLIGEWKQVNSSSEDSYQIATISEDTIEIYWYTGPDEANALYWAGSFTPPETTDTPYSWNSVNDRERTGMEVFASNDEEKVFTFQNGQLSYEASALGITQTVTLEKNGSLLPPEALPPGIGDTLTAENFDFTLVSVSTAPSLEVSGVTYTPEEGNVLLIAVITAVNTNAETLNVMNTSLNVYVGEEKAVMHPVAGEIDGNMPLFGVVSSGTRLTGYTVWEIPQDQTSLQLSYTDALTGTESGAFVISLETEGE